jgi:hypothetical protein
MINHSLTKKDKRVIRELISKGIEKEFKRGLEMSEQLLTEWRTTSGDDREYYHKLRDELNAFHKRIVSLYDYTPNHMKPDVLSVQVREGLIDESELDALSPEGKEMISSYIKRWTSYDSESSE